MRCIFFISLYLLSVILRKAYAFSPTECLKQLTTLDEKAITFTGSENVYCAYLRKDTIENVIFNIKDSDIDDWDVTVGQLDKKNLSINNVNVPVITDKDDYYKLSTNVNNNVNTIIWVLKKGDKGEITNVKINKTLVKRAIEKNCKAFDDDKSVFFWNDISWDSNNEKYIGEINGVGTVNLNNTAYLDTFTVLFKKKNSNGSNDYFTGDFKIVFNMRSDTSDWMVYSGYYNKATSEVEICHEWDIAEMEEKGILDEINVNEDTLVELQTTDKKSDCNNNIIWWQSVKNDQNSQRIWMKELQVKGCNNKDD